MNYVKEFLKRGLFGIPLGVFINQFTFFILAWNQSQVTLSSDTIISQFIISAICGFYFVGVSIIFRIEQWSLLRQTLTHSIAMLPYFPIAYFAGWMPAKPIGIVLFTFNYLVIYIIIWVSYKKYWEKKAQEINRELQKRNQ